MVKHTSYKRGLLVIAGWLLLASSLASSYAAQGWAAQDPDSLITEKVRSTLATDPGIRKHDIEVWTLRGHVVLRGYVDSLKDADKVTELVKNVEGVRSIQNNLVIWQEGYPSRLAPHLDFQSAGP
ncbi:MAG: hypothetical protein C4293_14135 [Nitrospiraceae bacterium]